MRGRCGGHLDVDMNAGAPYSRAPVENIYWGVAPKGRYRIWVENFRNCPEGKATTQVALRWLVQHGVVTCPGVGTLEYMRRGQRARPRLFVVKRRSRLRTDAL